MTFTNTKLINVCPKCQSSNIDEEYVYQMVKNKTAPAQCCGSTYICRKCKYSVTITNIRSNNESDDLIKKLSNLPYENFEKDELFWRNK